uniref:C2H2-type domain-containing protein n=1 Tax=Oryza meridionalis TaxID=40149 RepID=A0A0E0E174_9ORYZ
MSGCSWICSLVILQAVCSACWQVAGANSLRLAAGQIGGVFVYLQDPSRMSRHARDELVDGSCSGDEDLADHGAWPQPGGGAGGDHGGVPRGGEAGEAEADVDVDGDGRSAGEVECQVCHKRFKNDKSMFGHLRSHPNRGYKGATPPLKMSSTPSSPQPPPSSSSSLRPVGESNSSMPTPGISLTTYEKLAACVMLTLRRRHDRDQRQLQAPPTTSPSCSNKRKLERAAAGGGEATTIMEGAEGSSRAIVGDEHEHEARRRKKGKRKLKEPREEERKVKKEKKRHPYMCKHCNEEFSTHQALGGHMAGHHKEERILLKEKQRERSLVLEKEPERSHHLMEEKHPERGLILEKKQLERSSIVLEKIQLERSSIVLKEKQPDRSLTLKEEQPEVVYQDKIDHTMNWHKTERNEGASYFGGGSNTAPIAQEDSCPPFGFDLNVEAPEQE